MFENKKIYWIGICLLLLSLSCSFPAVEQNGAYGGEQVTIEPASSTTEIFAPDAAEERQVFERINPENINYLGAFRLPDGSGGSSWEYSGQGLTFYPEGDPDGALDGFSGSLFGAGHDHQLYVSEISIPVPVISSSLEDLNTAETLQPFTDVTGGIFDAEEMVIPVVGLAYLPDVEGGKLHFTWGQHIQDLEPSHGWGALALDSGLAAGPWVFGAYTNYITSDYLFDIPEEWAGQYAPGVRLASGRFREGVWGGMGPALLAYNPDMEEGLRSGGVIEGIVPLLVYGVPLQDGSGVDSDQSMKMAVYQAADQWSGGAWLSADQGAAVVLVGTKAMGQSWYGFADGTVWPQDCAEQTSSTCPEPPEWPYDDRGYWAEGYQAQMIFFDVNELGQVAVGEMETYSPQPYAVFDLSPYLFDPELNYEEYKRQLVGAMAFDRENGLIYVVERLADEYKSVIHVFQIGGE